MALVVVTPPYAEPLDLAEAKAHSRIDIPDDDALVTALIGAARDYAEGLTQKQLVVATFKQVFDSFPGFSTSFAPYGHTFSFPGNAFRLHTWPVVQVLSIQYLDMQGATQTVDPTTYVVDASTEPARITPLFGTVWPIPLPQIGAVWVNFIAGYAAPIAVAAGNLVVKGGAALAVGNVLRFSNSGGALPPPLQPLTDYYVQAVVSPGVYTLAASLGGGALVLVAGTGTSFLGVIPNGIMAWLKIRLATLCENREEGMIGGNFKFAAMPYVDRLLDSFRTTLF